MIRFYVIRVWGGQLVTYFTGEGRDFSERQTNAYGFTSRAEAERKAKWLGRLATACAENEFPIAVMAP